MVKNLLAKLNKKDSNKGFTLVELIVVLVILAILAAILVPALLGYIDRAREKQYVLNAKSWLTAAQAELSSIYGEGGNLDKLDATRKAVIKNTADIDGTTSFTIGTVDALTGGEDGTVPGPDTHGSYTIKEALYVENGYTLYFDGSSWQTLPKDTTKTLTNSIQIYPAGN